MASTRFAVVVYVLHTVLAGVRGEVLFIMSSFLNTLTMLLTFAWPNASGLGQ